MNTDNRHDKHSMKVTIINALIGHTSADGIIRIDPEQAATIILDDLCRCGHTKHEAQCKAESGCWCDTFSKPAPLMDEPSLPSGIRHRVGCTRLEATLSHFPDGPTCEDCGEKDDAVTLFPLLVEDDDCGDICGFAHTKDCDGYCDHGFDDPHRNGCLNDQEWKDALIKEGYKDADKPIPSKLSPYELMPIAKLMDEHEKEFYPSWRDFDPHPGKYRDELSEDELKELDVARSKHSEASDIATAHREAVSAEMVKRIGHLVDEDHEFAILPLRGDKAIIIHWYEVNVMDDYYNVDGHVRFHLVTSAPKMDMILVTENNDG